MGCQNFRNCEWALARLVFVVRYKTDNEFSFLLQTLGGQCFSCCSHACAKATEEANAFVSTNQSNKMWNDLSPDPPLPSPCPPLHAPLSTHPKNTHTAPCVKLEDLRPAHGKFLFTHTSIRSFTCFCCFASFYLFLLFLFYL